MLEKYFVDKWSKKLFRILNTVESWKIKIKFSRIRNMTITSFIGHVSFYKCSNVR